MEAREKVQTECLNELGVSVYSYESGMTPEEHFAEVMSKIQTPEDIAAINGILIPWKDKNTEDRLMSPAAQSLRKGRGECKDRSQFCKESLIELGGKNSIDYKPRVIGFTNLDDDDDRIGHAVCVFEIPGEDGVQLYSMDGGEIHHLGTPDNFDLSKASKWEFEEYKKRGNFSIEELFTDGEKGGFYSVVLDADLEKKSPEEISDFTFAVSEELNESFDVTRPDKSLDLPGKWKDYGRFFIIFSNAFVQYENGKLYFVGYDTALNHYKDNRLNTIIYKPGHPKFDDEGIDYEIFHANGVISFIKYNERQEIDSEFFSPDGSLEDRMFSDGKKITFHSDGITPGWIIYPIGSAISSEKFRSDGTLEGEIYPDGEIVEYFEDGETMEKITYLDDGKLKTECFNLKERRIRCKKN